MDWQLMYCSVKIYLINGFYLNQYVPFLTNFICFVQLMICERSLSARNGQPDLPGRDLCLDFFPDQLAILKENADGKHFSVIWPNYYIPDSRAFFGVSGDKWPRPPKIYVINIISLLKTIGKGYDTLEKECKSVRAVLRLFSSETCD